MDQYVPVLGGEGTLAMQLADAVVSDIQAGALPGGSRLPATRVLAQRLGVHRNTVVAAYEELKAQGWAEGRAGAGTYAVALDSALPSAQKLEKPGFALPALRAKSWSDAPPADVLELAGGRPDLRLLPVMELSRSIRGSLSRKGARLLSYGDPQGLPRLRRALADWLAEERGLAVGPAGLLVTRGAQQALFLLGQTLLQPGDRVAVEELGYPPAWEALRMAGAELVPIPVDASGLDVDALERAHRERPLRAVYLTPHHQFPTMAVLPPDRRQQLLRFAGEQGLVVLEDDYDNEFHFQGRPVLPLAHQDPYGVVVYIGTLSKVLAPGLRLGFVAAHPMVIEALVRVRAAVDRQGDAMTESAIASLVEQGEFARHLRRMKREYSARQEALHLALQAVPGLRWSRPPGGLAFWVGVEGVSIHDFQARCRKRGVHFDTAERYHFRRHPLPFFRCGFAPLAPHELQQAVGVMAACLGELR